MTLFRQINTHPKENYKACLDIFCIHLVYVFPQPLCKKQDATQRSVCKAKFNWFEFRVFFTLNRLLYPKPVALPIAGWRTDFKPFSRILTLCELQIAMTRI